jgi:hypothetical protein
MNLSAKGEPACVVPSDVCRQEDAIAIIEALLAEGMDVNYQVGLGLKGRGQGMGCGGTRESAARSHTHSASS